jgi:hypothetical protein
MKPHKSLSSAILTAVASAAFVCTPVFSAEAPQPVPDNNSVGLTIPAPQPSKSVWMSREAADVLKLVHANVNDEVVMAYIQNSRIGFSLTADEIVQLHNEGVSDKMINAMLSHRKQAPQVIVASQQPAQEAPQQQVIQQPTQPPPMVVAQPQSTYVQSQPVYVPATSYVYSEPYYSYDPYYWNSWWYPSVAFNFGFRGYGHSYYPGYAHYAPHYYGGYRGAYGGSGYHGGYAGGGSRGGFGAGVHWGGGGGHRR